MDSRRVVLCVLAVVLALAVASQATASVLRVRWNSPNNGSGNDWDHAYTTVTAALSAAVQGDEIWVAGNADHPYAERITLKGGVCLYGGFNGTETSLEQRSWTTNVTILDGDGGGTVVTLPLGETAESRIDGFTIQHGVTYSSNGGGGILCRGDHLTIANNTVQNNCAGYYVGADGGGIRCALEFSNPPVAVTITNNVVMNNTASGYGGGISGGTVITGNTVVANTAANAGGISGGSTVTNNKVLGNSASKDYGGMACGCSSGLVTITGNTVLGNTSPSCGGMKIACTSSGVLRVTNNVIAGNGGTGVWCDGSTAQLMLANNTIIGNSTYGVLNAESRTAISNNIIAFNATGVRNSSLYSVSPTLRNNDVYGNTAVNYDQLSAGLGDISADPLLVSPEYGGAHIQPTSPCKDRGWVVSGLPLVDMDRQPRTQGTKVDIGADESDGTFPPAGPYTTIYVSPDGSDFNLGTSWALAKRTVQAGVDAASILGGEVWVRAGTYAEHIILPPYVHLYGGFAGDETAKSERDWLTHETILDGHMGGHVVAALAGRECSCIDGFTIRGGLAEYGAGIYCKQSSPLITNNNIMGNNIGSIVHGGGISCYYASPTITRNRIVGNAVESQGGGIYCYCASPIIGDNVIMDNKASKGGGIYCDNSQPVIAGNLISCNYSHRGAGIGCYGSSPQIAGNTVVGNSTPGSSGDEGAGLWLSNGSSATVTNNTIVGNSAQCTVGGGLHSYGSSPVVSNNIIAFNTSGLCNSYGSSMVLRNNCVYGNGGDDYTGVSQGDGDIALDPMLVSSEYGNFHLLPGSPCVGAGWNAAAALPSLDMDGQARVQSGTVDIGADESDGTTALAGPYAVVRVAPDGADANDGLSWATAKRTVQAAIDSARAIGGEVWVKSGTYSESVILHAFAYLYGGFAGTETERTQRNSTVNKTTIRGNGSLPTITVSSGHTWSCVDGFIVCNGVTYGIRCNSASPTIANNTVVGYTQYLYGQGGVIGCYGSAPLITDNVIVGYSGSTGGGVVCNASSPTITNNTIVGNTASISGAGVLTSFDSSPVVSNNIIAFNSTGICAAVPRSDYPPLVLRNNNVYGSTLSNYSGPSGYAGPSPGVGDISADPVFANRSVGDYRLKIVSPCVNAGWDLAPGLTALDIAGQPRQNGIVDIGAYECWPAFPEHKQASDGLPLSLPGVVVSAAFADYFYIQSDNRSGGIRVNCPGHALQAGMRADVIGALSTTADSERCIEATDAHRSDPPNQSGSVDPLCVSLRSLGGGDWCLNAGATGGQQGITGASGLNNIGILIRTCGRFTKTSDTTFTLDDGSGVNVSCVAQAGVTLDPSWTYVAVTGVSSCERQDDELHRLIRVTAVAPI